jgi:uncharacterized membrane protein YdbT with pleckstrin-like domain
MSYVGKVLQPGESIIYETKLSWAMYLPGLLLLLAGAVFYLVVWSLLGTAMWSNSVSLAIATVAVFLLLVEWFQRWITEIAITDRRIILKKGFIRRDTIEMSVEKVESIDVNQSLLGRLLDYGDITVRGTGSGFAPLLKIESPLNFRSHLTGVTSKAFDTSEDEA